MISHRKRGPLVPSGTFLLAATPSSAAPDRCVCRITASTRSAPEIHRGSWIFNASGNHPLPEACCCQVYETQPREVDTLTNRRPCEIVVVILRAPRWPSAIDCCGALHPVWSAWHVGQCQPAKFTGDLSSFHYRAHSSFMLRQRTGRKPNFFKPNSARHSNLNLSPCLDTVNSPTLQSGMKRAVLSSRRTEDPNIAIRLRRSSTGDRYEGARLRLVRGWRQPIQFSQCQCIQNAGTANERSLFRLFWQGSLPRSEYVF